VHKKLIYEEKLQTGEEMALLCMDGVVLTAHGKQLALFKKGSPGHKQRNNSFQTASSFKYADFVTKHIDLRYVHLSSIAEGDLLEGAGSA
jgi:hypothetical protein